LKASVDVVGVIGAVVSLEPRGADLAGRCPFHDDETPSLVVTPSKQLWHCFGCGAGGDVLAFVMKQQRVSFRHAVEILRAGASLSSSPMTRSAPRLPSPVTLSGAHHSALWQVTGYYHSTLKESAEALGYLEKRGISSSEAVEHFKLGYANRTLGLRLPGRQSLEGTALRDALAEVGVFRESGHEHLSGSLVVPFFDERGDVVGMYGRKIHENLRAGTAKHLYLPGPHRGVFNLAALSTSSEVILCEAVIDALTFWCAGFRNVTASFGVEGFTDEMLRAFKGAGVRTVLCAYDRDDAGDAAAAALSTTLAAEGIRCARVLFPKGMDANAYALKLQPAHKSLGLALERARDGLAIAVATPVVDEPAAVDAVPVVVDAEPVDSADAVDAAAVDAPSPHPLAASAATTSAIASTSTAADMVLREDELIVTRGDRRYRVRGFAKNKSHDVLKVNLHVSRGSAFHVDTLDLYAARFRAVFMKLAAHELGVDENVIKADLGVLLLRLEELQDEGVRKALTSTEKRPELTPAEEQEALALLRDPELLVRVLADFNRCGVVGEEVNKLMGYLGMTSRMLERPLAVIIQSSSAAGKSSLMDAILAFCPDEERIKYSAMTGQSLFYMSDTNLKHKVLAVVEEEGAEKASYSLKLLQSEGELIIASTGKDPETGRMITNEYKVEGPVMLFLTTTAIEIDEELMNRCLVLTVDEGRAQTRAIHKLQRERRTLGGRMLGKERAAIVHLHQNAQRLLRPLVVANPFAEDLTFVDDRTRTRRDHMKYLNLIDTIALVHQHQREVKAAVSESGERFEYIEATLDDIELANALAHVVLGRSLDELPPQTRKLLRIIDAHVARICADTAMTRSDVRLTRRELLDVSGFGYSQLTVHLDRLVALEHVLAHAGKQGRSFIYELVYDGHGDVDAPHLSGLIDVKPLRARLGTTATSRGVLGVLSALSRPVLGEGAEMPVLDDKSSEGRAVLDDSGKRATAGAALFSSHHTSRQMRRAEHRGAPAETSASERL
jgi:DNA primase catalytic core